MNDALDLAPGHRSPFNLGRTRQDGPAYTAGPRSSPNLDTVLPVFYVRAPSNISGLTPKYVLPANSVEMTGFEPVTFALQRRCSPAELHPQDLLG